MKGAVQLKALSWSRTNMGAKVNSALALSILVVDDEPNIRKTLQYLPGGQGHQAPFVEAILKMC